MVMTRSQRKEADMKRILLTEEEWNAYDMVISGGRRQVVQGDGPYDQTRRKQHLQDCIMDEWGELIRTYCSFSNAELQQRPHPMVHVRLIFHMVMDAAPFASRRYLHVVSQMSTRSILP